MAIRALDMYVLMSGTAHEPSSVRMPPIVVWTTPLITTLLQLTLLLRNEGLIIARTKNRPEKIPMEKLSASAVCMLEMLVHFGGS